MELQNGPQEDMGFFDCKGPAVESIDKEYDGLKSSIMNGIASKELYDCRHGIMGLFLRTDDPPSKAITGTNIKGAYRVFTSLSGHRRRFAIHAEQLMPREFFR